MAPEKVLIPSLLLLLSLLLMPTVSSNPHSGVARGHGDQRQTSGRWLWEDGQECECKGKNESREARWLSKVRKNNLEILVFKQM
ncbi:C-X-C motif chemokine 17 [Oryctolagus cuniculus]|uniref:C-X-C motif chemokine 17 n=1 Tax=Oryctolagus cuniculus TaxID=9986 RepID=UPI0038792E0C